MSDTSLPPAIVKEEESLFQVSKTGNTTKYMIAYSAVTIIPMSLQGTVTPVPNTMAISLDEDQNTSTNVIILGQDIHIYVGSVFQFPAANVTIIADRIFAEANPGATTASTTITFNCNGAPAPAMPAMSTTDANPPQAATNTYTGDGEGVVNAGAAGKPGAANTTPGGNAGSFIVHAALHSNLTTTGSIYLTANCIGGDGGLGQAGGNGGQGGNGAEVTTVGTTEVDGKVYNGADGGLGGVGGDGSAGGNGGFAIDLTTNGGLPSDPSTLTFSVSVEQVAAGNPGAGGAGGISGIGGSGGSWTCFPPAVRFPVKSYTPGDPGTQPTTGTKSDGSPNYQSASGNTGPNTALPGLTCADTTSPLTNPIGIAMFDTTQLSMVMKRLMFQYQLFYCSQVPSIAPPSAGQPATAQFLQSLSDFHDQMQLFQQSVPTMTVQYLQSLVIANPPTVPSAAALQNTVDWLNANAVTPWQKTSSQRAQVYQSYQQFLMNTTPGRNLDIFGQKRNYISLPNLSLATLHTNLKLLNKVEKRQQEIAAAITNTMNAQQKAANTAAVLQKTVNSYESDMNTFASNLSAQSEVVQQAKLVLRDQITTVHKKMEKFWSFVSGAYTCGSLMNVLDAASSVLALAGPEMQPIVDMATAFNSTASGLGMGQLLGDVKGITPNTLQGTITVLNTPLAAADLQDQIANAFETGMDPSSPTNPINTIIAAQNDFNNLIGTNFQMLENDDAAAASDIQAVQDAFTTLVTDAKQLQAAATTYTDMALSMLKRQTEQTNAQTTLAALGSQEYDPSLSLLDIMGAFYNSLYTFQKAAVTKYIFDTIRACNGLFLQPSTLLEDMAQFETFDDITADAMDETCTLRLTADIENFLVLFNQYPSVEVDDRAIVFTPASQSDIFAQLQQSSSFVLALTPENISQYAVFDPNWFDVRLLDMEVYLLGATNTKAGSDTDTQTVDVNIVIGDSFTVVDSVNAQHVFRVPVFNTTFSYNYSTTPPHAVSVTTLPKDSNFSIDPDLFKGGTPALNATYPMRTPYMIFNFSVDKTIVDLTNVTEVKITFKLMVRNSGGVVPGPPGSNTAPKS